MAEQQRTETKPEPKPEPKPEKVPHSRRWIILITIVVVFAAGAWLVWRVFFVKPKLPDSIVALSGRIEGDDSTVAPKTNGRILEIRFREGDRVKAGDIIATLSDEQIRAREDQARAALSMIEAKSRAARDQIAVLQ